ncbi:unnamed protein product [Amoebophrya sp. A25]|nr:unnamed protein product [Amoebophrya sp. A25]|eukprot:GSA25T00009301001.1
MGAEAFDAATFAAAKNNLKKGGAPAAKKAAEPSKEQIDVQLLTSCFFCLDDYLVFGSSTSSTTTMNYHFLFLETHNNKTHKDDHNKNSHTQIPFSTPHDRPSRSCTPSTRVI